MHFLNNGKHALVFPPRCGTRWIAGILFENELLDTKGPHHRFEWEDRPNVETFMFVRNPFTRERSIHRWLAEVKKIDIHSFTFEDYIDSEEFELEGTWYTRYGDLNKHVTHIHLENVNEFLENTIGIEAPSYNNLYHLEDDNRNDIDVFRNQYIVDKILDKYKQDLQHIDFDLTSYT